MFEPGSVIKIKNKAGVLLVNVCEKLNMRDITMGIGDNKLPPIQKPRLEFHRRDDGIMLVTLCNRQDEYPCDMFLFVVNGCCISAYRGEFLEEELEDEVFTIFYA